MTTSSSRRVPLSTSDGDECFNNTYTDYTYVLPVVPGEIIFPLPTPLVVLFDVAVVNFHATLLSRKMVVTAEGT